MSCEPRTEKSLDLSVDTSHKNTLICFCGGRDKTLPVGCRFNAKLASHRNGCCLNVGRYRFDTIVMFMSRPSVDCSLKRLD